MSLHRVMRSKECSKHYGTVELLQTKKLPGKLTPGPSRSIHEGSFFVTKCTTEKTEIQLPVGNNEFSFAKRMKNPHGVKSLTVAKLIEGDFTDLQIGDDVVFQDFTEDGNLKTCFGLKNFVRTQYKRVPVIIFDNHNHAFFFWCEAKKNGLIQDGATLVHFDQHSDMKDPSAFLSASDLQNLEKVFEYTNTGLNVGNFMVPAVKSGLIKRVIQVLGQSQLEGLDPQDIAPTKKTNCILDIDMDFFVPGLSHIDFAFTRKKILAVAEKCSLITVATSPFFIDQKLAIQRVHELFL